MSMRGPLAEANGRGQALPAARFVMDFKRLITDVDHLMADIRIAVSEEGISATQKDSLRGASLNDTISSLREHARLFERSLKHYRLLDERDPIAATALNGNSMLGLAAQLSFATSLKTAAQVVGAHCRKVLGSVAGMIFIE